MQVNIQTFLRWFFPSQTFDSTGSNALLKSLYYLHGLLLVILLELDNIAFWFAENGYVGDIIMADAEIVQAVSIQEEVINFNLAVCSISFRSVLFIVLTAAVMGGYAPFAWRQHTGVYFNLKYPKCPLALNKINKMGDGVCDGGLQNS